MRALVGDRGHSQEAVADLFGVGQHEDRFERGLDILLDGIELYLGGR